MDSQKIEDSILKLASEYFTSEILPYFGIRERVTASVPTEMITAELNRQYMDYTFLTEDEVFHHFEFQSTDGKEEDLQRFHGYEAVLVMKTGKAVITHVIYTGNILNPMSEYEYGINKYRVDIITLGSKDAERVLERIEEKRHSGESITREECLELILVPLMGGGLTKQEKILRAIKVTRDMKQKESEQMLAMLYAFAEKFLTKEEKQPIEEVIMMTELGQMILDRGVEKGIEKGIEKGMEHGIALTKKTLALSAQGMSCEEIASQLELTIEKVRKILD